MITARLNLTGDGYDGSSYQRFCVAKNNIKVQTESEMALIILKMQVGI